MVSRRSVPVSTYTSGVGSRPWDLLGSVRDGRDGLAAGESLLRVQPYELAVLDLQVQEAPRRHLVARVVGRLNAVAVPLVDALERGDQPFAGDVAAQRLRRGRKEQPGRPDLDSDRGGRAAHLLDPLQVVRQLGELLGVLEG